jgi:hypothetical protein
METGTIYCPHCGGIHPEKARFCPVAGVPLYPTCPQCGSNIDATWIRCANCAAILRPEMPGRQARIDKRKKTNRIFMIILLSGLFLLIFSITAFASSDLLARSGNAQIQQLLSSVQKAIFPNQVSAPVQSDDWEDYDLEEELVTQRAQEETAAPSSHTETPEPTEVIIPPTESATSAPTSTSIPSETPTIVPSATVTKTPESGPWLACPGIYLSRLRPGDRAKISEDPPLSNRVRSSAGIGNKVVGTLRPGERVEIIDGPECSNDMVWWKVKSLQTDVNGWTSEGDRNDYWLVPIP